MPDLEKRAEEMFNKMIVTYVLDSGRSLDYARKIAIKSVVDFAQSETALLSKHILDLQKTNGALTNRVNELEKENIELKAKWLQATDEGTSWAHRKSLEQENLELKKLIKNIIRVTWGEGWNYSLDWKVKAEAFINKEN